MLRMLLNQVSGYSDDYTEDYLTPEMATPTTPLDIVKRWTSMPLDVAPGTLTDDAAEHFARDNENNKHTAEEVLAFALAETPDEKLTSFALRLTFTGYVAIPRKSDFDFFSKLQQRSYNHLKPQRSHVRPTLPSRPQRRPLQRRRLLHRRTAHVKPVGLCMYTSVVVAVRECRMTPCTSFTVLFF